MATKTIYITVRMDIENPNVDEITDDMAQEVLNETDYIFNPVGDFLVETEICGINE